MSENLLLHSLHVTRNASFRSLDGMEFVADYGEGATEYRRLRETAGLVDLSGRGRLCILGEDRVRFLNGQLTNDIKRLAPGSGCYAAMCSPKGRMEADAVVYRLEDEFLLDLEPGLLPVVSARFQRYIIADDVELADASEAYGCLSVQGPLAGEVLRQAGFGAELPDDRYGVSKRPTDSGDCYVANQPRAGGVGFDMFVPVAGLAGFAEALLPAAEAMGGGLAGWEALEVVRVEDGVPRFGADMDGTTLPPEAGLEDGAISYTKGCYIGQEVMGRLRSRGRVARRLVAFRLEGAGEEPPKPGEAVLRDAKPVGQLTSVVRSPRFGGVIALGYLRREVPIPVSGLIAGAAGDWKASASGVPLQAFAESG